MMVGHNIISVGRGDLPCRHTTVLYHFRTVPVFYFPSAKDAMKNENEALTTMRS